MDASFEITFLNNFEFHDLYLWGGGGITRESTKMLVIVKIILYYV